MPQKTFDKESVNRKPDLFLSVSQYFCVNGNVQLKRDSSLATNIFPLSIKNMADRQRDSNRRNSSSDDDVWNLLSSIGTVVAGAAAIGAVGYKIYQAVQGVGSRDDEERNSHSLHFNSAPSPRPTSYYRNLSPPVERSEDTDKIIVAVDATERRAGGLLILLSTKQIYFYSIDWSNILKFPSQPDKFEMVNAFLALEIFKSYVKNYRERGNDERVQSLVLKTDNTFSTSRMRSGAYPGLGNEEYRKLYRTINDTLISQWPYLGEWKLKHAGNGLDMHMKMADKLSRNDYSDSLVLPTLPYRTDLFDFDDYHQRNISKTDYAVVHTVAMRVPGEIKF